MDNVNRTEYESFENKNLFTTIKWLRFLKEFRRVKPVIIRIFDDGGALIGYFTAAIKRVGIIKVLGSPFYGWMGQHMGFDFAKPETVDKSAVIDEVIPFLKKELHISFIIFADYKLAREDIEKCKEKLCFDTDRWTYFIDLTQSEEKLFKNFRNSYRTCVRKYDKMVPDGIVEDYDDGFIEEHHRQLKEVFARKSMTSPNYRKRMKLLYKEYTDMVLSIRASDEEGNSIASSYYLAAGSMAFFASNASLTKALRYNANQALMWYAMRYFKSKGIKTLDLAGRADYKANFGAELRVTPTIVWAKRHWQYRLVMWARNAYYQSFRLKYKIKYMIHKSQKDENTGMSTSGDEIGKSN